MATENNYYTMDVASGMFGTQTKIQRFNTTTEVLTDLIVDNTISMSGLFVTNSSLIGFTSSQFYDIDLNNLTMTPRSADSSFSSGFITEKKITYMRNDGYFIAAKTDHTPDSGYSIYQPNLFKFNVSTGVTERIGSEGALTSAFHNPSSAGRYRLFEYNNTSYALVQPVGTYNGNTIFIYRINLETGSVNQLASLMLHNQSGGTDVSRVFNVGDNLIFFYDYWDSVLSRQRKYMARLNISPSISFSNIKEMTGDSFNEHFIVYFNPDQSSDSSSKIITLNSYTANVDDINKVPDTDFTQVRASQDNRLRLLIPAKDQLTGSPASYVDNYLYIAIPQNRELVNVYYDDDLTAPQRNNFSLFQNPSTANGNLKIYKSNTELADSFVNRLIVLELL